MTNCVIATTLFGTEGLTSTQYPCQYPCQYPLNRPKYVTGRSFLDSSADPATSLQTMPKRGSGVDAAVPCGKKSREHHQPILVISGLYAEGKAAVARCLLGELKNATVITSDVEAGRVAVPKGRGAFKVITYTTDTPQPLDLIDNVLVLAHELARPSRVAEAMTSERRRCRLLTVLDARRFLDDWQDPAKLPLHLRKAAKDDARAHLHDKNACEVLAEFVESADVIVLSHADAADADEVEMMEGMLRELNPSVTLVRRTGDGSGGGKLLERVARDVERPPPAERGGCTQTLLAARRADATASDGGEDGDEDADPVDAEGHAARSDHESEDGSEDGSGDGSGDGSDNESDNESGDGSDIESVDASDHQSEEEGEHSEGEHSEGEGDDGEETDAEGEEEEDAWTAPVLSSFSFFARRPFHPARLHRLLKRGPLDGVIRSRGLIWVATHPEDAITWNQVRISLEPQTSLQQSLKPHSHLTHVSPQPHSNCDSSPHSNPHSNPHSLSLKATPRSAPLVHCMPYGMCPPPHQPLPRRRACTRSASSFLFWLPLPPAGWQLDGSPAGRAMAARVALRGAVALRRAQVGSER